MFFCRGWVIGNMGVKREYATQGKVASSRARGRDRKPPQLLASSEGARIAALDVSQNKLEQTVGEIIDQAEKPCQSSSTFPIPVQMQRRSRGSRTSWAGSTSCSPTPGQRRVGAARRTGTGGVGQNARRQPEKAPSSRQVRRPYIEKQGGSVIVTSSVNGTRIFSTRERRPIRIESRAGRLHEDGDASSWPSTGYG